jgi:folate-binding protein YgfZ
LLQPQGKVDAFVRVVRVADDTFVLDTDAGHGAAVVERLSRFKLRTKAEIEARPWSCLALRGPLALTHSGLDPGPEGVVAACDWPGLAGVDLLGPAPVVPEVAEAPLAAYEIARSEAGFPVMGAELDERTIPAESGVVDRAVSFTKGCFTGQELVARIDARGGNVPRRLRGLRVDDDTVPAPGTGVHVDGRDAGRVTSAAAHPDGGVVALAYIRREVEPPATATLDDGRMARIETLPLIS